MFTPSAIPLVARVSYNAVAGSGLAHPDIKINHLGGRVKPVQMIGKEADLTIMDPEPLPDPIVEREAAIERRDLGLISREQLAIDVDFDGVVARVIFGIMGSGVGD